MLTEVVVVVVGVASPPVLMLTQPFEEFIELFELKKTVAVNISLLPEL